MEIHKPREEETGISERGNKRHRMGWREAWMYGTEEIVEKMVELINGVCKIEGFPLDWREGVICPIFKKGEKNRTENYRGIFSTYYDFFSSAVCFCFSFICVSFPSSFFPQFHEVLFPFLHCYFLAFLCSYFLYLFFIPVPHLPLLLSTFLSYLVFTSRNLFLSILFPLHFLNVFTASFFDCSHSLSHQSFFFPAPFVPLTVTFFFVVAFSITFFSSAAIFSTFCSSSFNL
jgi:hypothetical protein